jgi:hypothetical protein
MVLVRDDCTDTRTLGTLTFPDGFVCQTLEDAVRDSKIAHETAIPSGTYPVTITLSQRFGFLLPLIGSVPSFTGIRIHSGNTKSDTSGCVLVGSARGKQDNILGSRVAMAEVQKRIAAALADHGTCTIEIVTPRVKTSEAFQQEVKMKPPNLFPVVQRTASAYPHLLIENTYESCLAFTQRVLMACGDASWGHVGKTAGESQSVPVGFTPMPVEIIRADGQAETIQITGVSHDAIFHLPSNTIVDILGKAAANSDSNPAIHGSAVPQWTEIPSHLNRINNPWIAAIAVDEESVTPPQQVSYPGDEVFDRIGVMLFADYASARQSPNPQMGRWFGRTVFDYVSGAMTLDESIAKHRKEWQNALGLEGV